MPLFRNEKFSGHEVLYWEHEGNRAIRKGDWKMVSRFDYKDNKELPWELYNIKNDRPESKNLIQQHPEIVQELQKLYATWYRDVKAVPYHQLLNLRNNSSNKE